MRITISGTPGSGKSTLGPRLAEFLEHPFYDGGQIRRELAAEHGLTLAELNELGEHENWTDREVDSRIERLNITKPDFVIVSRTAHWIIPDATTIYLSCDPLEGAKRIMQTERGVEKYDSIEQAVEELETRKRSDIARYQQWFGKSPYDPTQYQHVIDTTDMPQDIAFKSLLTALGLENKVRRLTQ